MEWGQQVEGSKRSKRIPKGLSTTQIRIMGALENCHNTKTECTPINVRERYVELYGEKEKPGAWEKAARELCGMGSIFTVNSDGTWALTAWKLKPDEVRYIPSLLYPVIGESGGENVFKYGGGY
jgi:hypothetical protein